MKTGSPTPVCFEGQTLGRTNTRNNGSKNEKEEKKGKLTELVARRNRRPRKVMID
jgi:hypothetical protein